jgi:hypothetical protein
MAVEIYKCKRMGEEIYDLNGEPLACKYCVAIEFDRERRVINLVKKMMFSTPRIPRAFFTCPATNFKLFEKAVESGDVWRER